MDPLLQVGVVLGTKSVVNFESFMAHLNQPDKMPPEPFVPLEVRVFINDRSNVTFRGQIFTRVIVANEQKGLLYRMFPVRMAMFWQDR